MAFKCKKVPVELKLMVPVELKLKIPAELKVELKKIKKFKGPSGTKSITNDIEVQKGPSLTKINGPSGTKSITNGI